MSGSSSSAASAMNKTPEPKSSTDTMDESPHCAAAQRVPLPPKTGNKVADKEARALRSLVQKVIDELIERPQLAIGFHQDICEAKEASREPQGDDVVRLLHPYDIGDVNMGVFLSEGTGLSITNWVTVKDNDKGAPELAMHLLLQLPRGLRFPTQFRRTSLLFFLYRKRREECGNRHLNLKKRLGYAAGDANLAIGKKGCYELRFRDGWLYKVVHISGVEADIDKEKCPVPVGSVVDENHDDMTANISSRDLPPIFLHTKFEAGDGPHAYDRYIVSRKKSDKESWANYLQEIEDAYTASISNSASGSSSTRKTAEDAFAKSKKDASRERMQNLRRAAEAKNAETMKKRKWTTEEKEDEGEEEEEEADITLALVVVTANTPVAAPKAKASPAAAAAPARAAGEE
jgi:hypothetical protein